MCLSYIKMRPKNCFLSFTQLIPREKFYQEM